MNQIAELSNNEVQTSGSLTEANFAHETGVDVWGILRRRKWIVMLGTMLGLGLGYIYLLQASPVYESVGQVLIEERKPPTIPIAGFDQHYGFASAEAKHAHLLMSPTILTMAYADYGLSKLPAFADESKALINLRENLDVQLVEEGTNILNVGFRGGNPDDTQHVVNAVLDAYKQFLTITYKKEGNDTRSLISEARDDLWRKIEQYNQDYREFKKNTPLLIHGEDAINIHQERQLRYEQERIQLKKQLAEVQARVTAVQDAFDRNLDLEAVVVMAAKDGSDLLKQNNSYRDFQKNDRFLQLLMEEDELTRKYGKDHPDVQSVRSRLEKFTQVHPEVKDKQSNERTNAKLERVVHRYLDALRQSAVQLNSQIDTMDKLFAEESEAAKQLQEFQAQEEYLRSQIRRTEQLFEVVVKSLEEANMVDDYESYTYQRLAEPAIGEKVAPLAILVIPLSTCLGGLAGFGLAYLVDVSDKAFRTPDEVSQIMQLPVVGHIPLIETQGQNLLPDCNIKPVICTVHRPKSPQSESYRAVRTALYFNNKDLQHQVIQITSPMPGDGKSTLAANLAVTISQSGKRVLLMDADFRRPALHTIFGIQQQSSGLASIVSGETEPLHAMQSVPQAPNLRLLTCGPRPSNPSELLSSEQFAEILDVFREQFDFVLVDTPPILAVSDPCAVAARTDSVILTFRIHKRARPLAVRARNALLSIGANVVGVVVNGIDQEAGDYYSQYRYRYAGYRYAYNYRKSGNGTYNEIAELNALKRYYDEDRVSMCKSNTRAE